MNLQDSMQMYEHAREQQFAAEQAGDLITALHAQRVAAMWWNITRRKHLAAVQPPPQIA